MKETVNVSIAGIAFILDKECYVMLSNYLTQTSESLRGNPASAEILADIEARIAEEILSVQNSAQPVPIGIIRPIIERLGGTVQADPEQPNYNNPAAASPQATPLVKRLYRNPIGAKLGGVCTGLATYFNTNVALFRFLFLLPVILKIFGSIWHNLHFFGWDSWDMWHTWNGSFSGTAILIYIILWIVIPQAKTPRQKLEMQGESITVDSLSQNSTPSVASKSSNSAAANTILTLIKVFALGIISLIFLSFLGGMVVGFSKLWVEMGNHWTPIPEALDAMGITYFWATMIIGSIILIPLFSIMYILFCATINVRSSKWISSLLGLIWFGLLILATVLILSNIAELSAIDWHGWHGDWGGYWHIDFD